MTETTAPDTVTPVEARAALATALADFHRLIAELEPHADDDPPDRAGS